MTTTENSYYLSKIPMITSIHPIVKKKYEEEIGSSYARSFLESPYLSDQTKIKSISYLDKKAAEKLQRGISATQKADKLYDKVSSYVSKIPESSSQYDLYLTGSGNRHLKKVRKSRKKRTRKYKRKNTFKNR